MEHMDKKTLIRVIDSAMHRVPADLVIYNCQIVDVFTGTVRPGSIAITDGLIVGFGNDYRGQEEIDAGGAYAALRSSGAWWSRAERRPLSPTRTKSRMSMALKA